MYCKCKSMYVCTVCALLNKYHTLSVCVSYKLSSYHRDSVSKVCGMWTSTVPSQNSVPTYCHYYFMATSYGFNTYPPTMLRFSRDPGGQGLAPRGARPGGRHLMPRLRRSRARGTATCACGIVEPGVRHWPNCRPKCKTAYRSVEIMGTRSCLHKL